jgi:hypothetical protein
MSVSEVRDALAEALAASGTKIYAYPPAVVTPPALVLVPSEPYLEPLGLGRGTARLTIRLRLTFLAGIQDNPSSLARLEDDYVRVAQVLPTGYSLGALSRPQLTQVGPSELLAADAEISATVTVEPTPPPDPDPDPEPDPEPEPDPDPAPEE